MCRWFVKFLFKIGWWWEKGKWTYQANGNTFFGNFIMEIVYAFQNGLSGFSIMSILNVGVIYVAWKWVENNLCSSDKKLIIPIKNNKKILGKYYFSNLAFDFLFNDCIALNCKKVLSKIGRKTFRAILSFKWWSMSHDTYVSLRKASSFFAFNIFNLVWILIICIDPIRS